MKKSIIFILLMASLAFSQTQPKKIKMQNSAKSMQQEIEQTIPIGSNIADAQQILQANGFRCQMKQQESFIEVTANKAVVEHKNLDFLFCDKSDHMFINTRFWQVAVVHKKGTVSEILNSVDKSPVLRKKDYIHLSDADIRNILLKYAPLGSSEDEVKRMLRNVFHRGYKKNSDYTGLYPCPTCPKERGGFALESHMQHYDYLRNFFLSVNYVLAIWYFDNNGALKDVKVSHEWDGV